MALNKFRARIKTIFNKEKLMRFLDKQGFYIVLFICICIIGVTAFLTSGGEVKPQDGVDGKPSHLEDMADSGTTSGDSAADKQDVDNIDIKIKDVLPDDLAQGEKPNAPVSEPSNSDAKDTSKNDQKEQPASESVQKTAQGSQDQFSKKDKGYDDEGNDGNTEAKPVISQGGNFGLAMGYPLEGEILRQYSMDELVYSKTLKEWTTHPGMDIESFLGAEVKAAMAGVVEQVEEDPLMGIVITLDHGNGVKTRYANLSTANMVVVGQEVEAGQIISGVGRTAGTEILDAPHLHFEVIIDEKNVDPAKYLK